MKLNDTKLRNLKPKDKPYRVSDGGGLYIEVMPNGSMYWRMNYRFGYKQKRLAFGVYPRVKLRDARDKREEARKLLDDGIDPSAVKKQKKRENAIKHANSFENVALEWHQRKKHTWKGGHADKILTRLKRYVFPHIGDMPISDITAPDILALVRPIEKAGKYETAHRMFQTTSQIFRFAVASGIAQRDVTADLKGALHPVQHKNYAHLSSRELPEFLAKLDNYDSEYAGYTITKLAFKLLIHTFVRSVEIRGAKWEEIEWDKKVWRIPAERMKMREQHIVPLAKQTIKLLRQIQEITGDSYGGYLFPSQQNPRKVMSENTFLRVIEKLGYKGKTTGHGFRSTASTILNENGLRPDVIERQLAHAERDQIRAAYNHAEYLKERKEMMQWWADYLERVS